MRRTRIALAGAGLLFLGYGGWLMVRWQSVGQLAEVVGWAAGGVLLHDAVLAPLTFGTGWLIRRRLPRWAAAPAAVTLILVGSLVVAGFSVLGRSHGGGKNHTLLDRDYPAGLLFATAVVVGGVAAGYALARGLRRTRGRLTDGTGHGR